MYKMTSFENQIHLVSNFDELIGYRYKGKKNAVCWKRELIGDFSEIVQKFESEDNIVSIEVDELREINLSENGHVARLTLLNDFELLTEYGASPTLNLISCYEEDLENNFFPTDVYSFHVDRSPIPADTFLCTYHGDASDILPNSHAIQKVRLPEIANELINRFKLKEGEFEDFIEEHFFDLHYQALPGAKPINLGKGNLWRLAIDHPQLQVPPCIHRAPREKSGQKRLLIIC